VTARCTVQWHSEQAFSDRNMSMHSQDIGYCKQKTDMSLDVLTQTDVMK